MSAKPSTVPRWANVGGLIVTPPSGKLDVGWVGGELPAAQFDNWQKNLCGQWTQYLNDGDLTGAHTFASTVRVDGLLTANAGITAAVNQHVTLSGTGKLKHGNRTVAVSAAQAVYDLGGGITSTWTPSSGGRTFSAAATAYLAIPVLPGFRVESIDAYYNVSGVGSVQPIWRVLNVVTGVNTVLTSGTVDSTGSARESQTFTPGYDVGANEQPFVSFTVTNAANIIYGLLVTYSQP